jgi:16S rRNA (adenine1518-N6/adenine1519-N6)-dimethyltransferase
VYGTPKYVKTISKQYFKPIPSVDSAIIAIENISRNFFKEIEEGRFFELLKAGFAFKRKLLIRNLERVALRNHLEDTFQHLGIPKNTRAEDLPKDMWYSLAQVLP